MQSGNPVTRGLQGYSLQSWKRLREARKGVGKLSRWDEAFIHVSGEPRSWLAHWFRVSIGTIRKIQEDTKMYKRINTLYKEGMAAYQKEMEQDCE